MVDRPPLTWTGEVATVEGADFLVAEFRADVTTPERFVVWKSRALLESTLELVSRLDARRVVELGIAQGGSVALLALHARPDQLLAIELGAPNEVLEAFLDARGLRGRVQTTYGVDQSDRDAVHAAAAVFRDQPIDLVLDDASHRLAETRASFDALFPMLRPGGVYAIEDWSWGHRDDVVRIAATTESSGWWPGGPPLTVLACEALLATVHPDVVRAVEVDAHHVRIVRGDAVLDPASFSLSNYISAVGTRLLDDAVDPLDLVEELGLDR